jgi:hypothetical protein
MLSLYRRQSATLAQAFDKWDAKALGSHWTEEGEYIDDGTTYRGRAAIEAGHAKFFAAHPKRKLELTNKRGNWRCGQAPLHSCRSPSRSRHCWAPWRARWVEYECCSCDYANSV